ncbi:MAG: class I SAM-dependent methyltransferase [Vibrio sp.]
MSNLRLCYHTFEIDDMDIHLCTLRNNQEFYDPQGVAEALGISSASWPIFGVVWPSSIVLAHFMYSYNTEKKRILEVGCGMALSSLMLNKRHSDITATDYHPESGHFLQRNRMLNEEDDIPYEQVDWANPSDHLGLFDVIIGSDLLYEDYHIELLANFINHHAKAHCEVILVDPGRGRKNKFKNKMLEFGFSYAQSQPDTSSYLTSKFKGYILTFTRTTLAD